ncbi:hypothetical protein Scep_002689 [Stephania cephalantha]|uniref:Protein disulfide-isomerase n=1 Tax=Stephania cephalantha TaxID=152367 RepID=A0AAP0Q575_9MAGN
MTKSSRVRVPIWFVFFAFSVFVSSFNAVSAESVLTLDHSNFTDAVAKHSFIVVEFYAPWCGHCKSLAPEYEKAASELVNNDPPIILVKVDANEEANKGIAGEFNVRGYPTLKIIRNGGKDVQDYKGPRDADGIVSHLKKQVGPASAEITSAEDASNLISGNKIYIVGVFPDFSGEEYQNFTDAAEKMRADYDFAHTKDSKFLPRGDAVNGPIVRLFKPFDELSVDFQDFHVDALVKFVEEASVPTVTVFNKDPNNHPFVIKFFNSPNAKAMLFLNFSDEAADAFKSKLQEVAESFKGKGISFLIGDLEASQGAFQYFGLKEEQVPLIVIQENDGGKYLKPNVAPDTIASWVKDYKDGKVNPYRKSEPIPEVNNEPVKVVVADTFQEFVNSGKNGMRTFHAYNSVITICNIILLEFYAPWCGHCQKLAPILEEVAISFQGDENVVIAKIDATANDIPSGVFDVKGYPTLYFKSADGNIVQYEGDRTKEDLIQFIQKSGKTEENKTEESKTDETLVKDEL